MYPSHISKAAVHLRQGGVIAYPTEGVWGLGCDPFNRQAVTRLLQLKDRPEDKGLILVAADVHQIAPLLTNLDAAQLALLQQSWPGPATWLLPDPDQLIPPWVKGKFATVAIRVSAHPVVAGLCRAFDGPLVSTSANPAQASPAMNRLRVLSWFGGQLDYVVPGRLGGLHSPTRIRDLVSTALVRE